MLKWHYCLHVNVKRLTTYQFSFERIFSDCLVCISHIVDLVSKFVNWPNYNEEQINYFKSKDKKMSKICPCSSKLIFLSDVLWGSFEILYKDSLQQSLKFWYWFYLMHVHSIFFSNLISNARTLCSSRFVLDHNCNLTS